MMLRPYQSQTVADIEARIASGIKRILIVAPTGAGKTIILSEIIKRHVAAFRYVVFVAHRDELLTQARDKLKAFGIGAGIIKSGRDKDVRPMAFVQICGIQTLHARAVRGKTMELPRADLLVIDEGHHCPAMTYQTLIEAYPDATLIGATATPTRGDGRGLGNVFETMLQCPQISELIALGHLVKLKIFAPPPPDLRGVAVASTGDYVIKQLSDCMDTDKLVGDIIEHWLKHSQRRRTVIFAVDVAHSIHIVNELRKSGVRAEHLDANTPQDERNNIIARLASGETEVISNCMILTEGFDLPDIGCIVLARPTRSLGLFRQMIGRGLRPAKDKPDVIVLDHSGGVYRHGRPDDAIEWTLDTDRKARNVTHEARVGKHHDPLCECTACGHLRIRGLACDNCGWEPQRPGRDVKVIDADLVEIGAARADATRVAAEREIFYAELRGYQKTARRKDGSPYSKGWAAI